MLTQLSLENREAPLLKLKEMSICGTLHDFVLVSYVPVSTEGNVVWSSNKIVCYTIEWKRNLFYLNLTEIGS